MRINTHKIVYAGVLIGIGILLPLLVHSLGGAGVVFLPMHIPVLLAGLLLGARYGLGIGMVLPIVSAFLLNMPSLGRMPAMVIELGIYGLLAGLIYQIPGLKVKKYGVIVTLIGTMVVGRIIYAVTAEFILSLFHIPMVSGATVVVATVTGIYGIIIQIILIPTIMYCLQKGDLLNGLYRKSN